MWKRQRFWVATVVVVLGFLGTNLYVALVRPHRILLDTDVDTDDLFALLYLLKLSRSEFNLEAVTIIANAWSDGGHAVNQVYDILYMMGRDDVAVGLGGEGGILDNGTLLPNVGGYLPIIDQGLTTTGGCRYRQAIPKGPGGRLDVDANFGLRRLFLPQGNRRYSPLLQPTAQQVLIDKVSEGPITLIVLGANTNVALFLMSNPHLKKNIEHIYVMGGALTASNHCAKNSTSRCRSNNVGNLFTGFATNPYAEFNMFSDPFAAYQVFHSGVPITLVPLDATNTIPISKKFFKGLEMNQRTYEAQYAYLSLKTVRDAMFGDQFDMNGEKEFLENYFLWDSFTTGVAISIMSNSGKSNGENDFAEMEYRNITVVTSNEPYGISDGSNPLFDNRTVPKFNLTKRGVHSGHVQTGLHDAFCISTDGKGKCKDGYTQEISGPDSVRVLVATRAKPNKNNGDELDREFYLNLLEVLSRPQQAGRFNFSSEFQYYREQWYRPSFRNRQLGRPLVFDMDMSAGDFLSLFYLLKVPVEIIDLKAIIVSPTGWANAATIDVIYDLLHMMGRDDIPVGLGDIFAMNQSDPIFPAVGDCKYAKAVPQGSGGFLDSDTLYGLGRDLPRSPRRYSAEKSVADRQPLALKVWENVVKSLDPGSKITVLTNGPLTSLAKIISSDKNATFMIEEVYIVGGHISGSNTDEGNVFTVPSNRYVEFNMYLDPLAAKMVFESELNITLVPLGTQRKLSSFQKMLDRLLLNQQTAEARFAQLLLSRLYVLQKNHSVYQHVDMFLGEILGAVILGGDQSVLKPSARVEHLKVIAEGNESTDGRILIDRFQGKPINILQDLDSVAFYELFASRLGDQKQSAVIGSFEEQGKEWSRPPNKT